MDGSDDVFAVATGITPPFGFPLLVLKLDAATGAELWRFSDAISRGYGHDIVADVAGDIFVHARIGPLANSDFVVLKLDGSTGAEVWRRTIVSSGQGNFDVHEVLALDAAGNVFAAGVGAVSGSRTLTTVKIDGTLGTELWRSQIHGTSTTDLAIPYALQLDAAGGLFVGGFVVNENTSTDMIVARLDAASGAELWRQEIDGTEADQGWAEIVRAMSVGPDGDPVAVGDLHDQNVDRRFTALKLDRTDGSLLSLPGKKMLVKDPGDPTKRFITFLAKDERIQSPAPGSIHDPRLAGATFRIWNPTTLEEATFSLPAGPDWLAIGTPPGVKGYRYKDKTGTNPCRKALLRHQKKLTVTCKAKSGAIPFTLDEPTQGSLAVSLQAGGSAPQCASFGGLVIADQTGLFKAKGAPGKPACD